jgi:fibro-slime domain-containing protein
VERHRYGTCALGCLILATCGLTAGIAQAQAANAGNDQHSHLPETLVLDGVVRDFRDRGHASGHPDFQWQPRNSNNSGSFGLYTDIVRDELDAEGKPVFKSRGRKVNSKWRNAAGQNIMPPREYIDSRPGDQSGSKDNEGTAVHTAEGFAQWFRDVPGVNLSMALPITLQRAAGTNRYVFDDRSDAAYSGKGGFFPVNGELYGNYSNTGKNFHFTFELETEFVYSANSGQVFTFIGDDDVWVFIDGKLVIDLGGVHGAESQTIDLDRLNWLRDGETYSLHFFFAERHTTQSNFKIETTLQLRTINLPTSAAVFD